jgi:hypothetical protein
LLDLARSFLGVNRRQDAVDALETLRELAPDGPYRAKATEMLAQLLLEAGGFDQVVLVLADELIAAGSTPGPWCDWLRAQALTRLGEHREALELMRGIDRLVDSVDIELPIAPVLLARCLLAAGQGLLDEAAECALTLAADHDPARQHLELVHTLWTGREADLVARLRAGDAVHRDTLLDALARMPAGAAGA